MKYLAVDLGGSHFSSGVLDCSADGARITARERVAFSATSFADVLTLIEGRLKGLVSDQGLTAENCGGVALGFPGIVDSIQHRVVSTSGKFEEAEGFNLNSWSKDKLGFSLALQNDALMALLGELEAGAAKGYGDVVMMTLGTGIGGAAVLDGKPLLSRRRQAGILGGHLAVRVGGRLCGCGNHGCAESEASTTALPALCGDWPGITSSSLRGEPVLDYRVLFLHAQAGDLVARQVVDYSIEVWSTLAVSLIHAYDPEIFLIGGGVVAGAEQVVARIRQHVASHAWAHQSPIRVVPAALGEDAALFGAVRMLEPSVGELH